MKRSSPSGAPYGGPTKRSRIDINPDSGVVRLRGLPFSAGEQEIRDFFKSVDLEPTHVRFILNAWGKDSGSAFVVFENVDDVETALKKDKDEIGTRYIEIFRASVEDVNNFPTRSNSGDDVSGGDSGSSGASSAVANLTLRLRGLPYSVAEDEILAFFDGLFFFVFCFLFFVFCFCLFLFFCFCFCFCFFRSWIAHNFN